VRERGLGGEGWREQGVDLKESGPGGRGDESRPANGWTG